MSKIYKSNNIKINDPRKLENVFPAHFSKVAKSIVVEPMDSEHEYYDVVNSNEDSLEEIEASKVIEEAKQLYKNIISEANRESLEMTTIAKSEANEVNRRAYDEGYDKGINDARDRVGSLIEEAQKIRDYLDKRREKQGIEIEAATVSLIIDISKKVIGCELEQNENAVISLVQNALTKNSYTKKASLRVSQEDFEIVSANRINILRTVEGLNDLEVLKDISLLRGSCIIDTPSGEINASIEIQIKELEKIFDFILKNDL